MNRDHEVIETDVAVIGSGGAGLRAAIEVREKGCDVLLLSKTPIGLATATTVSGGAFTVAIEGLAWQGHIKGTLRSGRGVNDQGLVRVLVKEAPDRLEEVIGWGLDAQRTRGGVFSKGKSAALGQGLTMTLKRKAESLGVEMIERVMATDLTLEEGVAAGMLTYDFASDRSVFVSAKAIILASGGAGALYVRNDNPARTTGDGLAIAYRAGAWLRDMEFVQFFPLGGAEQNLQNYLLAPTLADAGKILNANGEDVLKKHDIPMPLPAVVSRDLTCRAMMEEIKSGNDVDGTLLLDLTGLTEDKWPSDPLAVAVLTDLTKRIDWANKPVRIAPVCHHSMGGVVIDEYCRTSVPGLFAAGEVTGGVHGANRMGGNALSEILVFGCRAGRSAAEYASSTKHRAAGDLRAEVQSLRQVLSEEPMGESPRLLRREIENTLWQKVGIIRDRGGLEDALGFFSTLEEKRVPEMSAKNPRELMEALEVGNAVTVGRMIAESALTRTESRGAHYRNDYPEQDDESWLGNIYVQQRTDGMHLETRPIVTRDDLYDE